MTNVETHLKEEAAISGLESSGHAFLYKSFVPRGV